jgi:dihydroorotase
MEKQIEILLPWLADMHVHFRGSWLLQLVIKLMESYCLSVSMANSPWAENPKAAKENRLIVEHYRSLYAPHLKILHSAMLGQSTNPKSVKECHDEEIEIIKMIPANTSVGADVNGISLFELPAKYKSLEKITDLLMLFSGHWELKYDRYGNEIPELDRVKRAIPHLEALIKTLPGLIVIVEHIDDKEMLDLVLSAPDNVMGTVTVGAMTTTYDKVYRDGKIYRPENYYLPVAKTENDVAAIIDAITDPGNKKLSYGSDLAPHLPEFKRLPKPRPGSFCHAETAIPCIWGIFYEKHGRSIEQALGPFMNFMLYNAFTNYRINKNGVDEQPRIKLIKKPHQVPKYKEDIPLLLGGEELGWSLEII